MARVSGAVSVQVQYLTSSTALSPALRMYSRESHWTEFLQRPCQVVP